jgi:hypothetical protein
MIFDRILDLHNFEFINMVLSAEEQAAVYVRIGKYNLSDYGTISAFKLVKCIGILNIFNPCKPEGCFVLDLSRWDERQVETEH